MTRTRSKRREMLYRLTKRTVDVIASTTGLVVTAPLTVPAAVAVAATMGSPVFFRQQRPGKDGVPFSILKFRTMRDLREDEVDDGGATRITQLGKLLRVTSLDELPTLLNVLAGDMSLVGPRPLLVQYLERYTSEQSRRHEVKPGITGWSQVNGRNQLSWEDKFEHDVWYVDHRSLTLDAKILARTILKVLQRDGISPEEQVVMPEFLGSIGTDVQG